MNTINKRFLSLGAVVLALTFGAGSATADPGTEGEEASSVSGLIDAAFSAAEEAVGHSADAAAEAEELSREVFDREDPPETDEQEVDPNAAEEADRPETESTNAQAEDEERQPDPPADERDVDPEDAEAASTPERETNGDRPDDREATDAQEADDLDDDLPEASDLVETSASADPAESLPEASTQDADASASSTQLEPSNSNVVELIDEAGDVGDVLQENTSDAVAEAANDVVVDEEETSADPAAGTTADVEQSASSSASSTQTDPSNENVIVRVDSPGDNGQVVQTNASAATATATNGADPAGDPTHGSASATATSTQVDPSNTNVWVRVFSEGDNGSVAQTNVSEATAGVGELSPLTPPRARRASLRPRRRLIPRTPTSRSVSEARASTAQ